MQDDSMDGGGRALSGTNAEVEQRRTIPWMESVESSLDAYMDVGN